MRTPQKSSSGQTLGFFTRRFACAILVTLVVSTGDLYGQDCAPLVLRGEVLAGHAYMHAIAPGLDFKLEAVPAGWMIRVLPHGLSRPVHDYAELANPPYRSPTPLLISTDFAFRAQDAVAWNPRHFRYFTREKEREIAEAAYQAIERGPDRPAAGARLLEIIPEARDATFTILDAELAGGTADQAPAAAGVATHFAQTAHRVRSDQPASPLGKLLGLTFRVTFPPAGCEKSNGR